MRSPHLARCVKGFASAPQNSLSQSQRVLCEIAHNRYVIHCKSVEMRNGLKAC